jgi:AraC-like DNA-binding protein
MSAHSLSTRGAFRSSFRSHNADETLRFVSQALAPHEMRLKSAQPMATQLSCLDLGEVQIVDLSYGTDVRIDPARVGDSYLVHTAISGSSSMWHDAKRCTIRPGAIHVTSPGTHLKVEMTHRCRHLTVRLSKRAFDDYLSRELSVPVGRPLTFDAIGVDGGALPEAWRRLVTHIADQADSLPDLFGNSRIQRHYAAIMIEMLLSHHHSNYSELIAVRGNETAPWHVQRARAIIHDDFSDSLSVTGIAARVGVSVRSLQTGFNRFLGVSPVEYIRRHRLERLHEALIGADAAERVTDLMLDCGIVDFGRYAQHYRKRYGCSPSDTLRNARRH